MNLCFSAWDGCDQNLNKGRIAVKFGWVLFLYLTGVWVAAYKKNPENESFPILLYTACVKKRSEIQGENSTKKTEIRYKADFSHREISLT